MTLSPENRALIERNGAPKSTAGWDYALTEEALNRLLDAAREEGRAEIRAQVLPLYELVDLWKKGAGESVIKTLTQDLLSISEPA